MARKRGGIAGFYDRNKGVLKKAVPAALSFIPGAGIPLAALAGAAMGGDTEGKNYFGGFNTAGAIKGGLEGYGVGKGVQGARALLTGGGPMGSGSGLLNRAPKINPVDIQAGVTPSAAGGVAAPTIDTSLRTSTAAGALPKIGAPSIADVTIAPDRTFSMGGSSPLSMMTQSFDKATVPSLASEGNSAKSLLTGIGSAAKSTGNWMSRNKDLVELGGKGLMNALPNQANNAAMMNAETQRMLAEDQLNQSKLDRQREEERRKRIAELLMPYAQQNFPQYFGKMNG